MDKRARTATYEIEKQTLLKEDEIDQLETQKATQRNYYLVGGSFFVAAGHWFNRPAPIHQQDKKDTECGKEKNQKSCF